MTTECRQNNGYNSYAVRQDSDALARACTKLITQPSRQKTTVSIEDAAKLQYVIEMYILH